MKIQLIRGKSCYDLAGSVDIVSCDIIKKDTNKSFPVTITIFNLLQVMASQQPFLMSIPVACAPIYTVSGSTLIVFPIPDDDYILEYETETCSTNCNPFYELARVAAHEFVGRIGTIYCLEDGSIVLNALKNIENSVRQQLDEITRVRKDKNEY